MGTIKDRNSMDLTKAEDIKKGWQEYTEELYKKRVSYIGYRRRPPLDFYTLTIKDQKDKLKKHSVLLHV